ncbi:ATP-dependent RNA helicase DHX29 [Durusdinium trenchii]|uniref:ATP-dependent RNA helicase DHX29 n=1 Tax=Durusdinium trenchii TaxID=1381693 RepID=A0ABP0J3V8_9DINO
MDLHPADVICACLVPHDLVFLGSLASVANGLWQETKDVLVAELTNQGVSAQKQSQVWFTLGCDHQRQQRYADAERCFRRAAEGGDVEAAMRQALLLAKRGATAEAKPLLQRVLRQRGNDLGARWNLGLLEAHEGDLEAARQSLNGAIELAKELGLSPRRLAMIYEPRIYEAELKDEAAAFEAFASDLAPALGQLRRLVASPSWLMTWAVETVQSFGPDVTSASYGETFFKSWKAVIDHPEMVKVVEKSPAVVIMGSSLGYTCLFFAAVGIPCTGYDLLKQSMVQTAQEYVCSAPLQVPVEFKVGDASEAPLISRFQTPNMPSILWLNDEVWPAELRVAVKERAATELTVGSMVVSYGPQETTALRPEAALRVSTSWCRQEQIWLLRRV